MQALLETFNPLAAGAVISNDFEQALESQALKPPRM